MRETCRAACPLRARWRPVSGTGPSERQFIEVLPAPEPSCEAFVRTRAHSAALAASSKAWRAARRCPCPRWFRSLPRLQPKACGSMCAWTTY